MNRQKQSRTYLCEAEVVEGLEATAADELRLFQEGRIRLQTGQGSVGDGYLRFLYTGELWRLQKLRSVQAVYLVEHFAVPRPRALLGDQNFRIVINHIRQVLDAAIRNTFNSLELSAAGEQSSVMKRLKEQIVAELRLDQAEDKGDLLIRIIPAKGRVGWETLVRLTPRPLATRSWRVCNYEGALNATVAYAIIQMSNPNQDDVHVNLGAGSATLLIERALWGGAQHLIGIDKSTEAYHCAAENIKVSHQEKRIQYIYGDMRASPFPDGTASSVCADLPFGQRVGSHESNLSLYPAVITEAARITSRGGRFVFISHEINLVERLLNQYPEWEHEAVTRITLRGLHPRIYQLRRR